MMMMMTTRDTPFSPSRYDDTELPPRHVFFRDGINRLKLVEPACAATWSEYANHGDVNQREGAFLYWQLLPGDPQKLQGFLCLAM